MRPKAPFWAILLLSPPSTGRKKALLLPFGTKAPADRAGPSPVLVWWRACTSKRMGRWTQVMWRISTLAFNRWFLVTRPTMDAWVDGRLTPWNTSRTPEALPWRVSLDFFVPPETPKIHLATVRGLPLQGKNGQLQKWQLRRRYCRRNCARGDRLRLQV